MGFQNWFEGLIVICLFLVAIGVPCVGVSIWGSKMINDLGNFPTKSAQIQMAASWKIILVEVFGFALLIGMYSFLYSLNQ